MKLKIILPLILIIIIVVLVGYKIAKNKGEVPYEFTLVERGDIRQEVSLTGQVIPEGQV